MNLKIQKLLKKIRLTNPERYEATLENTQNMSKITLV